ncbi:MAG: hypothetical protein IKP31_01995 [Lachnospiraceae bacterium]|nr:hypothetical protein [Lachnospiraceae bacterium]
MPYKRNPVITKQLKEVNYLSDDGTIIFIVSRDLEFITHTCTKLLDLDEGQARRMIEVSEANIRKLESEYYRESNI